VLCFFLFWLETHWRIAQSSEIARNLFAANPAPRFHDRHPPKALQSLSTHAAHGNFLPPRDASVVYAFRDCHRHGAQRPTFARQNVKSAKITGRESREKRPRLFPENRVLGHGRSPADPTICGLPKLSSLFRYLFASILPYFFSSPARGGRGARPLVSKLPFAKGIKRGGGFVFLLMAAPPATRSGPPAGGYWPSVPERRALLVPPLRNSQLTGALFALALPPRLSPPAPRILGIILTRRRAHPALERGSRNYIRRERSSCRRSAPS